MIGDNEAPVTRRRFLAAGSAGVAAPFLGGTPVLASSGQGRAKAVIVLYLYGAPSQMDTLDPKPHAPVEMRGEFQPISTSLPGIAACELLPRVASCLDRTALVRSMSHSSNNHAVSVALSALAKSEPAIEGNGNDPRHEPYFDSVLEYLWKQRGVSLETTGIPVNMVLPWALNSRTDPGRWQHHAAWLGKGYNPIVPRFEGRGSLEQGAPSIKGTTPILTRFDPWDGVVPESRFYFDGTEFPPGMTKSRFDVRHTLLESLEAERNRFGHAGATYGQFRDLAVSMMNETKVVQALDVTREPARVHEKYGRNLFAQSALAARRLIEVGVKVVTVFWDTWTDNNAAWDTHSNHHPRLKQGLCPKFDQLLPAFLDDMQDRGLLDETLVLVISEHGRTPTLSNGPGGGREHWAEAYWGMFFGAGIRTGQVIGQTNRDGGYPITLPIHPNDILATTYHLLGFDPQLDTIPDRAGRPMRLVDGEIVHELLEG